MGDTGRNHYCNRKSYEKILKIYAEFAVFSPFFDLFPYNLPFSPIFPVDEKTKI